MQAHEAERQELGAEEPGPEQYMRRDDVRLRERFRDVQAERGRSG